MTARCKKRFVVGMPPKSLLIMGIFIEVDTVELLWRDTQKPRKFVSKLADPSRNITWSPILATIMICARAICSSHPYG